MAIAARMVRDLAPVLAREQLKLVLGQLQIATVRAQVSISIYDDMTDFTSMSLRDFQAGNRASMLDQLERWAGAFKSLRPSA